MSKGLTSATRNRLALAAIVLAMVLYMLRPAALRGGSDPAEKTGNNDGNNNNNNGRPDQDQDPPAVM